MGHRDLPSGDFSSRRVVFFFLFKVIVIVIDILILVVVKSDEIHFGGRADTGPYAIATGFALNIERP